MSRPVAIDCDPGLDDAVAMLLACGALDVKAVTTVAGNAPLEQTTPNAARLLSCCNRDVPLAAGMAAPLVRDLTTAEDVHGEDGLGAVELPDASVEPIDRHATELLADVARTTDDLVILSVGPQTNVAAAIRRDPELIDDIDRIVVMAGSTQGGNVTPVAEFNAYVDPEALSIVLNADVPVTMVGLNVTWTARVGEETAAELERANDSVGQYAAAFIRALSPFHSARDGWDAVPLHDALAAAAIVDPNILTTRSMRVDVETRGEYTTGATVCHPDADDPNVDVAIDVDVDHFRSVLVDAIGSGR